jgi:peptidoglycan hydrolase CwlO-like protein
MHIPQWQTEYHTYCDKLEDEQRITQEQLQPNLQKVREVDDSIKDQQGRIAAIKAAIAKNDERTREQLRWMVTG